MKNVTIKDVARVAGVSPSTVSRVISDSQRISKKTKKLVRKTMKELGYHQNAIARSLVTKKTNTIGLVMARPTQEAFANPFFSEIIQGIAVVTQKKHYNLILSSTGDYHEEQEETIKLIRNRRVDGVILMASRSNDELINQLLEAEFPFVLIGRSPEYQGIPIVNNDNIKAVYDTVIYLFKKNYQDIIALSGPREYIVSQDRALGYQKALAEHAHKNQRIIYIDDFTYEDGYQGTLKFLESNREPFDAILAFDDMIALGALRAVQDYGFKVPRDIGIVGFNDDPMISYLRPALTTVKIPINKMGKEAAEMLINILNNEDYQGEEIILPTELVIRETLQ
ncbi:LacI family DNA-binding transcriptional regulator [Iocasia frigidifontis]|uniref:LacI family DNA-binding transcriptional regulator n=1 Tax=Iocasia fonsfrigidae TaxID=2682810 RepID=A0A8A7KMV0_9FIRM|nr:LacI family DNA-binding transcriptional regulator [Iocasia fonsfrigidae]QTL99172.1 LacI family DNA-binding transcriptional regulator [Iocasia fonsfrigidae]